MKIKKLAFMKIEKKQLLLFLLVAFGLPFVMGIPLFFVQSTGKDISSFGSLQMFCPAAGFILAKLIWERDNPLLPKDFFISYLFFTLALLMWCFIGVFLSDETAALGRTFLLALGSLAIGVFYLLESNEKRSAYGLKSKNWKTSIIILIVFIILYFSRDIIFSIFAGTQILLNISPSQTITDLLSLVASFPFIYLMYLGEEYGWRCYFQPILQNRFGLIKGVLLFGVLWGIWHLPLDLFYYAPETPIHMMVSHQATCISLGIFMAYAYLKTKNLWLPILLHFFNNYLAGFGGEANEELTWKIVGLFAVVSFTLFLPFLFSKVFRKQAAT